MLFKVLIEKIVCPKIVRLLLYIYTNQQCYVQWGDARSDTFKIFNGVKQGGVISPLLFTIYIDQLFQRLKQLGLGCHVGIICRSVWLCRRHCPRGTVHLLFKRNGQRL